MKCALMFPGCHKRAGVERIMLECANFLARKDHQVTVYACDVELEALESSIKLEQISVPGGSLGLALGFEKAVLKRMAGERADILCTFGVFSPRGGVLWVQSVHRAWLEISQSTRTFSGRLKQHCNPFHPLVLHQEKKHFTPGNNKRLIALTEEVSRDLQRLYGVSPHQIDLLPNGFSGTDFNIQVAAAYRESERARLGYGPRDRVIVFVANELERKGFGPLIEAIARLQDDSVKLLVVGAVNAIGYQKRLGELGLMARTQFVGASSQVQKYYAAADVFALPTKYEAWGMVIIEAMACGLPVVTTKAAGAAIAIRDGENGLLVDNALDCIEIEQQLRKALNEFRPGAKAISDSVQKFTWDNVLQSYESILFRASGKKALVRTL